MDKIVALVRHKFFKKHYIFGFGLLLGEQLQGEIIRKSIHLLIAMVPLLAAIDQRATMLLLAAGTLFYVFAEQLRLEGRTVFIVSDLTVIASRERDKGQFVLGPVTLGLGAMLALLLYPAKAASIAIYALAFGDSLAGLIGRFFRSLRIPFTNGKTLAGSLACFLAVLFITFRLIHNLEIALIIALIATLLETLPTGDFDNLLLPVGTGFAASKLLLLT